MLDDGLDDPLHDFHNKNNVKEVNGDKVLGVIKQNGHGEVDEKANDGFLKEEGI